MNCIDVRARTLIVAFGAATVLSACGAQKGASPPARTITVTVSQLVFVPDITRAKVGDTIVWVNKDVLRHSATAAAGAFDVDLPPGATGRTVLTQPGVVKFSCRYHPGMTGEVHVAAKG